MHPESTRNAYPLLLLLLITESFGTYPRSQRTLAMEDPLRFKSVIVLLPVLFSAFCYSQGGPTAEPLPDIPDLLRSLQANQKNVEQLIKDYICTNDEREDELDSDGSVKKSTTMQYDAFYVGRNQIRRTISRNGKPLDEKEQRKEQERVEKRIKEEREKQAKIEAGEKKDGGITLGVSTFLRVSRFVNPRREEYKGHQLLAFDFEPNPQVKPSTKEEELAQKLSGTLWVDERAKQVARLDARLLNDVKFGGFLASVHKGAALTFEQQRINDEVWLPSFADFNVGFRVLFKGKREHVVTRYSNWRKFRVETVIKPVEPAQ
jgi:hypothetical protein